MGGSNDSDANLRRAVAVVDEEISDRSWQQLDLGLTSLPRAAVPPAASLSAPASGAVRSFSETGRALTEILQARARKSVPTTAFVTIGQAGPRRQPRLRPPPPSPPRRPVVRSANDNTAGAEHRSVWRDLVFLLVLAATVAGAFWSGRVNGIQRVIVVPEAVTPNSVVT